MIIDKKKPMEHDFITSLFVITESINQYQRQYYEIVQNYCSKTQLSNNFSEIILKLFSKEGNLNYTYTYNSAYYDSPNDSVSTNILLI